MEKLTIDFPLFFLLFGVNQLRRSMSLLTEISVSPLEIVQFPGISTSFSLRVNYSSPHMSVLSLSTVYAMRGRARGPTPAEVRENPKVSSILRKVEEMAMDTSRVKH